MRADSTGSTRGAFYPPTNTSRDPSPPVHSRKGKRKPPANGVAQNEPPQSSHGPARSMADLASMAFASLGDDVDGLMAPGTAPMGYGDPLSAKFKRLASDKRAFGMEHTPLSAHAATNYSSALSETGSSPIWGRGQIGADGIRTSQISGDSMQLSEASRGSVFSNVSDDSQEMAGGLQGRQNSSLYGTNFDEAFASVTTKSADAFESPRGGPQRSVPPAPPMQPTAQSRYYGKPLQQQEMDTFSSLIQTDYGSSATGTANARVASPRAPPQSAPRDTQYQRSPSTDYSEEDSESNLFDDEHSMDDSAPLYGRMTALLDPTPWLCRNAKYDADGMPFFDDFAAWTLSGFVRHYLFNPFSPEFTSLQQFNWAVILGVVMGFYTAAWKLIIENGLEFVWKAVPEKLLEIGVFTDVSGIFPVYHYMWICPSLFGGILSYIFATLTIPIPDQNEWINNVHSRGVQDYRTFVTLFCLSTFGMLSGLSLGPELPLVLTAGMLGSGLGLVCKQSMLQARVLNLTAASAAVGGFFGFPMAGALFVLEIPHRMGLQYFEALSPATIGSIVAVLCNRMVIGNDVTGYYSYPFLTASLPSAIFTSAIVYGLFGAGVGIVYALWVIKLKTWVHDLFHKHHDDHHSADQDQTMDLAAGNADERIPLVDGKGKGNVSKHAQIRGVLSSVRKYCCFVIAEEPTRAAVAGTLAGAAVGVIGMFLPHVVFFGEGQLQNLIDKGRTPLPIFGLGDEPTAALTALGFCMIDPTDGAAVRAGYSMGCSASIAIAKIVVTGLSLGTGIIGGHFWGPLFTGCAASHFLTDLVRWLGVNYGLDTSLAAYPCVVILCTMASTHVVTFRAHMAIMLILTLTISAFDPEDGSDGFRKVAGDYSAVFPLLVVSVFVSLMASRDTVFYKSQRSRGDIVAVPEVLCEPGMEGRPLVVDYDAMEDDSFSFGSRSRGSASRSRGSDVELARSNSAEQLNTRTVRTIEQPITQGDIERAFELAARQGTGEMRRVDRPPPPPQPGALQTIVDSLELDGSFDHRKEKVPLSSKRLDELLSRPIESTRSRPTPPLHRRSQSAPVYEPPEQTSGKDTVVIDSEKKSSGLERIDSFRFDGPRDRSNSGSNRGSLVRINSFGEVQDHQPSLLDQARLRSATSDVVSRHRRIPSLTSSARPSPRHSRKNSESSNMSVSGPPSISKESGTLSIDDIEQTFKSAAYEPVAVNRATRSPWTNNDSSDGGSSS
jgi:H+/Cl- antiporter ClcA